MEYNVDKREIKLDRELSKLDKLVIRFLDILKKYTDYVIISGYVSIILGRTRATEDVDLFIKKMDYETFLKFYEELIKEGFWCINAENPKDIFSFLENKMAVRFSLENTSAPNFELKFPKRQVDLDTFDDFLTIIMPENKIKISSLERQIAFKRFYLKSYKDKEDALHLEETFRGQIDYDKVNKLKEIVKDIED